MANFKRIDGAVSFSSRNARGLDSVGVGTMGSFTFAEERDAETVRSRTIRLERSEVDRKNRDEG